MNPFRGEKNLAWVVAVLVVSIFSNVGNGQTATADQETKPADEKAKPKVEEKKKVAPYDVEAGVKSFDQVWTTIKDTHWELEKVGDAWDEAKMTLRPKIEEAKNINEARAVINELLETLNQSHFGIIPTDAYDVVDDKKGGGNFDVGLTARAAGDKLMITQVRPKSPADKAGIKPGWLIQSIRERSADRVFELSKEAAHGPMRVETVVGMFAERGFSGNEDEKIDLVLTDGKDETQEFSLETEKSPGKMAKFGFLPAMLVAHETRTFENGVGYFSFSAFLDPITVKGAFDAAVSDEAHQSGMIIDLRGNIGGIAAMAMGMASPFVEEAAKLGVMKRRGMDLKFAINEPYETYEGPVAILIDECSISSAEILAGGMKDLKAARIFGGRSAGLALPSMVVKLPNGDGFQFAVADYISESGKRLEKDGVEPDEIIPLNRDVVLEYGDPVLMRARQWITEENANKKNK